MFQLITSLEGAKAFRGKMQQLIPMTREQMRQGMEDATSLVASEAERRAPVDTGKLKSKIKHKVTVSGAGTITGRVRPSPRYGFYAQAGRRPGKMPKWRTIERMVQRQQPGLTKTQLHDTVWFIRRHIGAEGTKGTPFLVPAFRAVRDRVVTMFPTRIGRAIEQLARGWDE